MGNTYRDPRDNSEVFAGSGLGGTIFMTLRYKGKGCHRVKTKNLPTRNTAAEARADLDAWAPAHGYQLIEEK